ncbi:MAG: TetR-like C-terminal domain-containing protein [Lachnospiraceae bacterium]|nr:TetR/AcrR family transcriptional regulator [Robinsoniella sp.]MDY3767141.1 TetR-like C-terminal domain-containing protein [Lachnospiraceae bacterium]
MNHKDNRRVQMTKKLLRDSLVDMLQTESIHKISIRSLCQRADINRSTFYKYYSSQYDLLNEMEEILLSEIEQQLASNENLSNDTDLVNILEYIQDHINLCTLLVNSNIDPDFPKKLLNLPVILERLNPSCSDFNSAELTCVQDFIIYGGYQMVKRWVNTGCRESPKEMSAIIKHIYRKLLD